MRGLSKKMLISILTSVVVFVTMIATTFAWVGIFTYANTDKFSLNLKVQELDANYFLEISQTGLKGSYKDEIPSINIKREIVNSRYNGIYTNASNSIIENVFNEIRLVPVTTTIDEYNSIDNFIAMNYGGVNLSFYESHDYYNFDLYLTVNTKEGITSDTTDIKSNVLLTNLESMIEGTICNGILSNGNPFLNQPSDINFDILKTIPTTYNVNSKNSVRLGLSIYEPINIDQEYHDEKPFQTIIYNPGNEFPLYNETTNCYDLGGCLPVDYNLAIKELLVTKPHFRNSSNITLFDSSLEIAQNRNDVQINEETTKIWDKTKHEKYLGCMDGIQTKMKISVYFWFEGWDADCLKTIEDYPVSLSLSFTSGTDN